MGRERSSSLSQHEKLEAGILPKEFTIKDSGERREFASGMVRDTSDGKLDWLGLRFGPMLRRWARLSTNGRIKYPDPEPGVPNWTLAEGPEERLRFKQSAARHFEQWLNDETDEDHAAAVIFNINGKEYVEEQMAEKVKAQYGAVVVSGHPILRTPKCGAPSASAVPCNIGEGHVGPHSWQVFGV